MESYKKFLGTGRGSGVGVGLRCEGLLCVVLTPKCYKIINKTPKITPLSQYFRNTFAKQNTFLINKPFTINWLAEANSLNNGS